LPSVILSKKKRAGALGVRPDQGDIWFCFYAARRFAVFALRVAGRLTAALRRALPERFAFDFVVRLLADLAFFAVFFAIAFLSSLPIKTNRITCLNKMKVY
jgi:hypothetical protein